MKYWLDTEFISPLELLSVGVVAADGRRYYAEVKGASVRGANPYVKQLVLPQLHGKTNTRYLICRDETEHDCAVKPLETIRDELRAFCSADSQSPEFWADYGAYDYVVLSEAFGGMEHWPEGWPWYFLDIQHWAHQLNHPVLPVLISTDETREHHAMHDASECFVRWNFLHRAEQAIALASVRPDIARVMRQSGPAGLFVPDGGRA